MKIASVIEMYDFKLSKLFNFFMLHTPIITFTKWCGRNIRRFGHSRHCTGCVHCWSRTNRNKRRTQPQKHKTTQTKHTHTHEDTQTKTHT